MNINEFALKLEEARQARYAREYPRLAADERYMERDIINVKVGPKYSRIDAGGSGHFMVENDSGRIYGIKGYGKLHRGHYYGTLETPADAAFRKV